MAKLDLTKIKDASGNLIPHGLQVPLSVIAKATGYTDSNRSNIVYYNSHPHIQRLNGTTLRITNCRAAETNFEIYLDGTKVGDAAYSGEDGGTLDVDVTSFGFTNQAINKVYVKGTGTGVAENQSETIGFWYGDNVILGVSGLYQSDPALTRTDDAVDLTWTMSNNLISSDFDNKFPYNLMQRETIDGDVFVYIPEMYWRIGYDSNHFITDIAVAPAAMEVGENQVLAHSDAFYYGAYAASVTDNLMYSKSGMSRKYNTTCGNFRAYAKARGAKYRQLDLYHMRILDFLWLIEFATKNSEAVMWGYTSYNGTCGATDSLTVPSGQLANKGRMRWRYIEDFIGNGLEFFDGAYGLGATQDESKYGQTVSDVTYSSYNGCLSALKIDEKYPLLAVPGGQVTDNNYSTYFCDYVYSLSGAYVYCRGRGNSSASRGLFRWGGWDASSTDPGIGSRLIKTL